MDEKPYRKGQFSLADALWAMALVCVLMAQFAFSRGHGYRWSWRLLSAFNLLLVLIAAYGFLSSKRRSLWAATIAAAVGTAIVSFADEFQPD